MLSNLIEILVKISEFIVRKLYPRQPNFLLHFRAFIIGAIIFSLGFLSAAFMMIDLKAVDKLREYTPPLPSKLLDRKERLITTFFYDQRILINLDKVPKCLPESFIAMEDNHFYEHYGLDLQAIVRAFLSNLRAGGVRQGGSTITQQLSKVILTDRARTYERKIKEAFLSIYLDSIFEKKEILNMYFNQIYFGHGTYGIEAASRFYFNKEAEKLNLGECAILASLPSAPNRFSPIKNPRLSMSKMSQVLLKMIDMGFISDAQAIETYEKMNDYYAGLNISPSVTAFGKRVDLAPYFSETIRQILEKEIGKDMLYKGGFTIYSSLDLDHQEHAQNILWESLQKQNEISSEFTFTKLTEFGKRHSSITNLALLLFDLPEFKIKRSMLQYQTQIYFHQHLKNNALLLNLALGGDKNLDNFYVDVLDEEFFLNRTQRVEGALVEIDNKTGEVTALIGGSPFNIQNQLNRAIQMKRQPGSTFKPLLYAAALEQKKITPATIFPDSPLVFLDSEGGNWIPSNYSRGYRGFITVREALRYSANLVSIAIARESGLKNLAPDIANLLHVPQKEVPVNLSVALGSYEVSPLQLTQAFSVFARGGEDIPYIFIHRITDSENKIVKDYDKLIRKPKKIISPEAATVMSSMLEEIVDRGTGASVRSQGYSDYAAGKTGTTDNYRDAWFVGYNERYTAAVWVGYDRSSLSLGPGQAGGVVAAPIWAKYQLKVKNFIKDEEPYLIKSENIVEVNICPISGQLPGLQCTETKPEFFIPGTEPKEICEDSHGLSFMPENNENDISEDGAIVEKIEPDISDEPSIPYEEFIGKDDLY
ncbi:MAG: PBP1A family penicillin-binding protein [Spirochaetia bacterium]|nr:PBP1A family penicillin-binding protein [Spirochaetia bacterium]